MKRLLIFILLPFILFGCNNGEENNTQRKDVEDVPPSLKQEQQAAGLVSLNEKEARELHIETITARRSTRTFQLVSPGITQAAPNYISFISAPVDGRIVSLPVNEGQRIAKGQVLMKLESLEYGRMISDYLKAAADAEFYESKFKRMQKLVKKDISSQSELEQIKADYKRAQAAEQASLSMLKAVGVNQQQIENMQKQDDINPVLNITSPIHGVMNENKVELGQAVKAYEKMASVINMKKLLIKAYISPQEGKYVKPGDSVLITQRKNSSKTLSSKISTMNPSLDANNRSLIANIFVNPQDNWPMPGENVRLEIQTSSPVEVIAIPMEAITWDDDRPVAFVKVDDRKYEKRYLELNSTKGDYAVIQSGIKENEEVAVTQVFSLKALARYEKFAE
jgi:cobalt-zinc-cadmium efflux system membrane fusion protein